MTQVTLESVDLVHTPDMEHIESAPEPTEPGRLGQLGRRVSGPVGNLRAVPNIGTWSGVLVAAIGGGLLVLAWGRTAGETLVGRQIPYLISAGFTGIGLVAVGLTLVNLAAKRSDALERSRQLAELRGLLGDIRSAIEDER